MADKKISALTAATTPLAGTEVLPIVQSGSTVKVSVANLTAGRAVASAGGTFSDNLIQGTAAKGVNFTANTPAAGMTSQLLNWYEEGTFTPEFTTSGGDFSSITYSAQVGRYVRIGRLVHIYVQIVSNTYSGGSGSLRLKGLPFNAANPDETIPVTFAFGWNSNPAVVGGTATGAKTLSLYDTLTNSECPYNSLNGAGANYLRMAGSYQV